MTQGFLIPKRVEFAHVVCIFEHRQVFFIYILIDIALCHPALGDQKF